MRFLLFFIFILPFVFGSQPHIANLGYSEKNNSIIIDYTFRVFNESFGKVLLIKETSAINLPQEGAVIEGVLVTTSSTSWYERNISETSIWVDVVPQITTTYIPGMCAKKDLKQPEILKEHDLPKGLLDTFTEPRFGKLVHRAKC